MMAALFGKPKTPKEQAREWSTQLQREQRGIEREISNIKREETKTIIELKKLAKAGNEKVLKVLGKAVVRSRKAQEKLLETKTQIGSCILALKQMSASVAVAGAMQKSAAIMQHMNSLVSLPQVAAVAQAMSKEMMKAGIIDEMVQESMEQLDGDDMEAEAEAEVDNVIFEITKGELGKEMPTMKKRAAVAVEVEEEKPAIDDDLAAMKARLDQL